MPKGDKAYQTIVHIVQLISYYKISLLSIYVMFQLL